MIGPADLYSFDATHSAHGMQQRGGISDAEIAARQLVAARLGDLRCLAAALAERIHIPDSPMAPAPV